MESHHPTPKSRGLMFNAFPRFLKPHNTIKVKELTRARGDEEKPVDVALLGFDEATSDGNSYLNVLLGMQIPTPEPKIRKIELKAQIRINGVDATGQPSLLPPPAASRLIFVDFDPHFYFVPSASPASPAHIVKRDVGVEGTAKITIPIPFTTGQAEGILTAHHNKTTEGDNEGVSGKASFGNQNSFVKWIICAQPNNSHKAVIESHDFFLKVQGSCNDRLVLQLFLTTHWKLHTMGIHKMELVCPPEIHHGLATQFDGGSSKQKLAEILARRAEQKWIGNAPGEYLA
ncbi:hypothetical protein T439DRAFT_384420 [Meredithblackwellia eburnea MCA 4105]